MTNAKKKSVNIQKQKVDPGTYQQKSNLTLTKFTFQQPEPQNFTIKTNMKYTRKHFGTWLKGMIYTKKLQSI